MEPTIEDIKSELNLTEDKAAQVHGLISGTIEPESFASVKTWLRQCYSVPRTSSMIMLAINEVTECHGVEAISIEGVWIDNYHGSAIATYCNTGDTYAATIMLDSESGEFIISSWGDFLEAWEEANP